MCGVLRRSYHSSSMWGTSLIWQIWLLGSTTTISTCLIVETWWLHLALKLLVWDWGRLLWVEQIDYCCSGLSWYYISEYVSGKVCPIDCTESENAQYHHAFGFVDRTRWIWRKSLVAAAMDCTLCPYLQLSKLPPLN